VIESAFSIVEKVCAKG
jgi:transposase